MLAGRGYVGAERRPLDEGQLAVFGAGDALTLPRPPTPAQASRAGWRCCVLGGLPIREPVARYGPFVMNTREEIIQAIEDYQAGRMAVTAVRHVPHHTSADEKLPEPGREAR